MDEKKHRHVFVLRILREIDDEGETTGYTGYLRIFFYDQDSRHVYLDFYDWCMPDKEEPFKIDDTDNLFSPFSYHNPLLGDHFTQDYTRTKPFPMPSNKEYDPDEGIKLCAEINRYTYEKAFKAWKHYKSLYSTPPVSTMATGILNHYERVIADFRQWYIDNCPEYLPQLSKVSTDIESKMPDRSRKDTEWLRKHRWAKLRDKLYEDDRLPLDILRAAVSEIPGEKPSLDDKTLFKSFYGYVNRRIKAMNGPGSKRTAKVDWDEEVIILSRKKGKKKK